MHKNDILSERSIKSLPFRLFSFLKTFVLLFAFFTCRCHCDMENVDLPTKFLEIKKSEEQIPIIILKDLSPLFEKISLILDSGSQQIALFDNQCESCTNTFAACPHIKTFSNDTLLTYLLTQLKGDFSYLTLADSLRIRFFCVLSVDENFNSLETNGIIGIKPELMKSNGQNFKQGNGLRTWRRILRKIYNDGLNNFENIEQQQAIFSRLKYSIFYSHFHTQLILGSLPDYFASTYLTQFSLKNEVYARKIDFFTEKSKDKEAQKEKGKSPSVLFDSGSSVIVLPWNYFQELFDELKIKVSQQCFIEQSFIKCPKNSIQTLIQSGFMLRISLLQDQNPQPNIFQVTLENLIERNHHNNDRMFSFKIYGRLTENEGENQILILGVPFFKQYLVQFDIPYEIDEKKNFIENKIVSNGNNELEEYWVRIHGHQIRLEQELPSPYEHLMKKQQKNVKIMMFTYFAIVAILSYVIITIYWQIHEFILGKRSIV